MSDYQCADNKGKPMMEGHKATTTQDLSGSPAPSFSLHEFVRDVKGDLKDGVHTLECRKGLWSVSGKDSVQVFRDAWHYYTQYYADGE